MFGFSGGSLIGSTFIVEENFLFGKLNSSEELGITKPNPPAFFRETSSVKSLLEIYLLVCLRMGTS